ncbi:hypothetical protein BH11PSE7_BH11PSE7_19170 [soil metagenome]
MKTFPLARRTLLACVALLLLTPAIAAEKDVGIVLMHGKWDKPPLGVSNLARSLESAGYLVVTPTMPWSGLRTYDVDYPAALTEIDAAAGGLKAKGAKRILVAGQSLGANAALAYAAAGREVDGVIVIAPGHTPERTGFRNGLQSSVTKARQMVTDGKGDEKAWFDDINQGERRQVQSPAKAYLSFFDPEGMGAMPRSAAAIPRAVPLFVAIGSGDALAAAGEDYLFNRAPRHEKSRYVVLNGAHMGLSTVAAPEVIAWLKSLDY